MASDLPASIHALLPSLAYPRPATAPGLAAWGLETPARRTHAWVRWDGATLTARLTHTPAGRPDSVLEMRWQVAPAGAAEVIHARDAAGPLAPDAALRAFGQALKALGAPTFTPVAPLPRPARARP